MTGYLANTLLLVAALSSAVARAEYMTGTATYLENSAAARRVSSIPLLGSLSSQF